MKAFIVILCVLSMSGCASMHPTTCSFAGGIVGGGLGMLVSAQTEPKRPTHIPVFEPPVFEPVPLTLPEQRKISEGLGIGVGITTGAFIGHQLCN